LRNGYTKRGVELLVAGGDLLIGCFNVRKVLGMSSLSFFTSPLGCLGVISDFRGKIVFLYLE